MKGYKAPLIIIIVVVVLILILSPYFIVDEGEQAVVIRFGRIIRSSSDAGLKFKVPLVDKVHYYPKKILSWDGDAQLYPTEENQYIWVDITARWRIKDMKIFYERLTEIDNAQSAVKTFTKVTYEPIKKGREVLSNDILVSASKEITKLGIDLIDVVVRQIKYSDDITQNVYRQMIKERNQIAQAFRSDGEGEKAKWLGKMEKELLTIRSGAEREAKEIKAKADAEALDIRNKAYGQDAEFAEFWMALKQYENLLPKMKKILATDFDFFKYMYKYKK
jgi:membrane protease subunit HflC